MGFTLQSFPLKRRIAPSSDTIPLENESYLPLLTQVQLKQTSNLCMPESIQIPDEILTKGFNAQVRSRPIAVLPDTGGRYSLELLTLSTSQCLSC